MSTEPTLEDVLREVLDSRLSDVHTALPGAVSKYDPGKQTADIQPLVNQFDTDTDGTVTTRPFPVLPSVPVVFPAAGGFAITFPVVAGDTGLLVFCELPIDRWRATGQQSHPADTRRHSISSAVFYPGLRPSAKAYTEPALDEDLTIGATGAATIHLKPSGEVHLGAPEAEDFVALAKLVSARLDAIQQKFDTHTHIVNTTGSAAAQAGTAAPVTSPVGPLQPVAASKVKAT